MEESNAKCAAKDCENLKPKKGRWCGVCRNTRQRYGITGPERKVLLEKQNSRCKLCKHKIKFDGTSKQRSACVDHNHETGKIRGILCGNCNTNIGFLENRNIDLDELKEYLTA